MLSIHMTSAWKIYNEVTEYVKKDQGSRWDAHDKAYGQVNWVCQAVPYKHLVIVFAITMENF